MDNTFPMDGLVIGLQQRGFDFKTVSLPSSSLFCSGSGLGQVPEKQSLNWRCLCKSHSAESSLEEPKGLRDEESREGKWSSAFRLQLSLWACREPWCVQSTRHNACEPPHQPEGATRSPSLEESVTWQNFWGGSWHLVRAPSRKRISRLFTHCFSGSAEGIRRGHQEHHLCAGLNRVPG